jgi:hypothetical protein
MPDFDAVICGMRLAACNAGQNEAKKQYHLCVKNI